MKLHPGKIALAIFLNITMFVQTVQAGLSQITFETVEWQPRASIGQDGNSGWQLFSGNAEVSPPGEGHGGGKSLVLTANPHQEAFLSKSISWSMSDKTAFIDFKIKPAADQEGSFATFYANGTQLAFQIPSGSNIGSIWAYHGNDGVANPTATPERWIQTAGTFHVPTGSTEADGYVRITLRHDYQRNLWDLFVDGKMTVSNLWFEGRGSNLTNLDFYGSRVGDTRVDDIEVSTDNMLFTDSDRDGLSDEWETAHGSNPNLYDRDSIDPATGKSYLDLYMASVRSGGGVIPGSGQIPPITILGNHQPVGALKGSLSIGGDGAANYAIPIDLPKGSAGMEPKISLGYSSNGGNGLFGLGWNLSGFQKITRGPSSAVKDERYDAVDFDLLDRFFFDGERLICVNGTYGVPGSEYRTEFDTFSRITYNTENGKDYWKVETKAGLIVYLGKTDDSRNSVSYSAMENGTTVSKQGTLTWEVNRVEDTVGNYYTVNYTQDAVGTQPFTFINHRISDVHYTGNGSSAPYCHVIFEYQGRQDITRAYTKNAGYQVSKLLSKIHVKTGDFVNHSYVFGYTNSYQTGRSLLTSVSKWMRGSENYAVPPTTFNYGGIQNGEPIWKDPGPVQLPTYSKNIDATKYVNSMVSTEDNKTTIRLSGDVAKAYPLSGVTLYPDSVISFKFKSSSLTKGAMIGLDADQKYTSSAASNFIRIGGSASDPIAMSPDHKFYGPVQSYSGSDWQTYTLSIPGTGLRNYLVLMCADDSISNGVDEAVFSDVRIYRTGQSPSSVQPIVFNFQPQLPYLYDGDGSDLGIVSMDLNADGLPDLADWRVTGYNDMQTSWTAVTAGNIYRNTGAGYVLDNSLRPGPELPLSVRAKDNFLSKHVGAYNLLADRVDINNDGRPDLLASTNINWTPSSVVNDYEFYTQDGSGWKIMPNYKLPFKIRGHDTNKDDPDRRTHHFQWVDLNGDGYQDLIVYTTEKAELWSLSGSSMILDDAKSAAFINNSKQMEENPAAPCWIRNDDYALPVNLNYNGDKTKETGRRLVDLDGDGFPEIAESTENNSVLLTHTYALKPPETTSGYRWNTPIYTDYTPNSPFDFPMPFINEHGEDRGLIIQDLNGDGLPDLMRCTDGDHDRRDTYINKGSGVSRRSAWLGETGYSSESSYILPFPTQSDEGDYRLSYGYEMMDINGDGLVDILYSDGDGYDRNTAAVNTGNGWTKRTAWRIPMAYRIYNGKSDREKGKRRSKLEDINGDGFPDLITNIVEETPRVWYNQCRPEVLIKVTDGFKSALEVNYKRLNDPTPEAGGFGTRVYQTELTGQSLPPGHQSVIDSRLVVSRYSEPDGLTTTGRRYKAQRYGDLRFDLKNQVSLGFGRIEAMDEMTGQITETQMMREFPLQGSPEYTKTFVKITEADLETPVYPGGPKLRTKLPNVAAMDRRLMSMETGSFENVNQDFGTAGGGKVYRTIQTGSEQYSYDLDGQLKTKTITTQGNFDAYGFVGNSLVEFLDGSKVVTESHYDHDLTKWHLGRLRDTQVIKKDGGKPQITKKSSFIYNANGLLDKETILDLDGVGADLTISKEYLYDRWGNIEETTVSSADGVRKSSSTYNSTGRFAIAAKDAMNHEVKSTYDERKAILTSTEDLNGKITSFSYDAFGTLIMTSHPDGTVTGEITGYADNNSLPASVRSQTSNPIKYFRAKQASGMPVAKVYLDAMGRELITETTILRNADAMTYGKVYTATKYDGQGRKVSSSEAFAEGETPRCLTVFFDMLNRAIVTTHPDGTRDEVGTYTQVSLNGRACTYSEVQNANGMLLKRWEDEHGRLVQSQDPSSQNTTFTHDHEGHLLSVAINGATLLTNVFDNLGNKVSVTEINSGTSTSLYNSWGEVKSSTNANGETTTSTYDDLGRVTSVTRPGTEGTFTYSYNLPHTLGGGKLHQVSGPDGYLDTVAYDSLGRTIGSTTKRGTETFTTATSYTALGLPYQETDAGGLTVQHDYDPVFSFPLSLRIAGNVEGTGTILWKAGTYDSKGRPLTQTLAQGIQAEATYHSDNSRLKDLISRTAGGVDLQRKYCHWDALGNLDQRIDHVAHMKEIFSYDGLNRVATVTTQALAGAITTTVPPPQTYEYDAKGNLKTKEGATMAYGGSRPHAVVSATVKGASRTYGYDDSGYVTSDSKRTYQWSSFGQLEKLIYAAAPALKDLSGLQVRGGGEVETRFSFDASSSRARQEKDRVATNGVRNYEDTLYLGSYEREIHSTAPNSSSSPTVTKTIHRHTLDGIGVYTKKVVPSSGGDVTTVKLTTVLKDHLGSTSVLYTGTWNAGTSAFANPEIENQSFNPWGERRDAATWANFRMTDSDAFRTSAQDYDRGYTGHEQLDDSGLIHMNGRIYDPEIGRFLSPDPYVQVPEYSQNFNRYSYVMNNPLNAVDPSGFSWISDAFHNLGDFIRQNWRTAVSMVFALAVTYFTAGIANPFVSGFVGGSVTGAFDAAINGGNSDAIWRGALVSGIQGGISSGILHPLGAAAAGSGNLALYGLHIVGHGLVGGAANQAMGGKFQDGFLSAAVSTAAGDMGLYSFIQGEDIGARAGRTFVAGIVGGTASQIGGGKFSNGFYTAAFQHLLNAEWHHMYPREFITKFLNANININEAANGLMLEFADHRGIMGLHSSGWNKDWKMFFKLNPDATAEQIAGQLQKMKNDPKYAEILARGHATQLSYPQYKIYNARMRNIYGNSAKALTMIAISSALLYTNESNAIEFAEKVSDYKHGDELAGAEALDIINNAGGEFATKLALPEIEKLKN